MNISFKRLLMLNLACVSLLTNSFAQNMIESKLSSDDGFKAYSFELTEATSIEFLGKSNEFDVGLSLVAGLEPIQYASDISATNTDALLFAILEPGAYSILVLPELDGAGSFTLEGKRVQRSNTQLVLSNLGNLSQSSETLPDFDNSQVEYFEDKPKSISYPIAIPAQSELEVSVIGLNQMDSTVHVIDSSGKILAENDDYDYTPDISRVTVSGYQGNAKIIVSALDSIAPSEFLVNAITRTVKDLGPLQFSPSDQEFIDYVTQMINSEQEEINLTGQEAPDFTLPTLDGESNVTLSELQTKVVLLDFWEPWCQPCLIAMPKLQLLHEEFGDRDDFVIYGIAGEDKDYIQSGIDSTKVEYGQLHQDNDMKTIQYGITSIPRMILIGKDGIVLNDWTGVQTHGTLRSAVMNALGDS